ncbi:MAG: DUF1552 domain-containing protein [Planctomycetota bacterium]
MAQFLTRRALSRRAVLRGVGASLALPWLDAMVPAGRSMPVAPRVPRVLFVFAPNGVHVDSWRLPGPRLEDGLSPTLEPLAPHRSALTVLQGLTIDGGRAHGDGPGDHARSAASFLTCSHPFKTGGAEIRAGVSIDQVLAREVGGATAFASLEVGLEGGRAAGVCDSGYSCAYSNNISWRTESTPMAKETEPRAIFTRLFGDPEIQTSRAAAARARNRLRSVLDAARGEFVRLRRELGASDQQKLDEYADAVRDIERRIDRQDAEEQDLASVASPEVLEQHRDEGFAGRVRTFYDLRALAFETDRTRVATLMLGNAGSSRSHRFLGVPEGHHELSHHGRDPGKLERIARIDRFQIECLAGFARRLAETRVDEGRSLLDESLVVHGSGISDGNRHNHDDLPFVVLGHGCGRVRGGRHLVLPAETPAADLYLAILHACGVKADAFADSKRPLAGFLN